ncbi:ShlB/FhaC/HecB family hemolysin secretion/activation protein [Cyanobium sp. NIES-981]|uniref:ShlB/FhaC/HecB family hemolysin secretion/activation protein n=1 Tax=Cyanobium sp. NIES-981 TaxID=1851505 RepID=UPI0007DD57EE|nr:ShlB/FhaC/HecB family hemolysin secretion/activation protein [Cyanobium sp. NIES-981]SBO43803.1 Hemolysin activation/secretion protein [Cyanobium sp. NIES-981]
MLLLAQLVAPPLQQGPVRLPENRPSLERRAPARGAEQPPLEVMPDDNAKPPLDGEPAPEAPVPAVPSGGLPAIEGLTLYDNDRLRDILADCSQISAPAERLNACAAALTAQFVADGYVNSRVFVELTPAPGRLLVVEGRLVELRVNGNDDRLNRRVARLMRSLQGTLLHLPSLERQLQLLRRVPGVKQVRGNLSRLGSDPTQATLTITLEGGAPAWQGDLSLRNDGNNGSGDARAVASFLKPGALVAGDVLLLYGELNSDDEPELGAAITSLTYTLPLGDAFNLTTAFGASRRDLIELDPPADGLSTTQLQGLGQLEWVFSESLTQRWNAFLGISGSSSRTRLDGASLPSTVPEIIRKPRSGYLRLGVGGSGQGVGVGWGGSAYLLAGLSGMSPAEQRREWREAGIDPSQATAIGGLISAGWAFAPGWQLNGRLAGQWAFNPLLPSMQFSLGSDVGLRGLPAQLISGDSGWLAVTEASWTFWQNRSHALQLVPFIGAGGVRSELSDFNFSDTLGSGGLLLRWLAGDNWAFELGWAHQFSTGTLEGPWNDWVLDDGLYAKAQFRF